MPSLAEPGGSGHITAREVQDFLTGGTVAKSTCFRNLFGWELDELESAKKIVWDQLESNGLGDGERMPHWDNGTDRSRTRNQIEDHLHLHHPDLFFARDGTGRPRPAWMSRVPGVFCWERAGTEENFKWKTLVQAFLNFVKAKSGGKISSKARHQRIKQRGEVSTPSVRSTRTGGSRTQEPAHFADGPNTDLQSTLPNTASVPSVSQSVDGDGPVRFREEISPGLTAEQSEDRGDRATSEQEALSDIISRPPTEEREDIFPNRDTSVEPRRRQPTEEPVAFLPRHKKPRHECQLVVISLQPDHDTPRRLSFQTNFVAVHTLQAADGTIDRHLAFDTEHLDIDADHSLFFADRYEMSRPVQSAGNLAAMLLELHHHMDTDVTQDMMVAFKLPRTGQGNPTSYLLDLLPQEWKKWHPNWANWRGTIRIRNVAVASQPGNNTANL